jgi:hypothetical protein
VTGNAELPGLGGRRNPEAGKDEQDVEHQNHFMILQEKVYVSTSSLKSTKNALKFVKENNVGFSKFMKINLFITLYVYEVSDCFGGHEIRPYLQNEKKLFNDSNAERESLRNPYICKSVKYKIFNLSFRLNFCLGVLLFENFEVLSEHFKDYFKSVDPSFMLNSVNVYIFSLF